MSRAKGNLAEDKACIYLYENGYEIIERNSYSRFGEIDVIVSKDNVLHFVEVKSGADYEKAIQNITPSKIKKMIKTANVYMKKNAYDGDFILDALIVTPESIEYLPNISL